MLSVLDARCGDWPERLQQVLRQLEPAPVLLSHCPPLSRRDILHHLSQQYLAAQPLTLLAPDLVPVAEPARLDQWLQAESLPEFAHLYLPAAPQVQALSELNRLIAIVARLRAPNGCPWDRAQTPTSLTPYILEEAYEAVAAIQTGEKDPIAEELGDLLLQVVLQAQIFSESGDFDLASVARSIADKLVRRHPHVFGSEAAAGISQGEWEEIKRAEKPEQTLSERILRYAETLPPLMAALKISQQVVGVGFEWPDAEGLWEKVAEEQAELRQALAEEATGSAQADRIRRHQAAELGDLLFTLVNVGRWHGLDPAAALQETNRRFGRRLEQMEILAGSRPLAEHSLTELERLWQQAKQVHP